MSIGLKRGIVKLCKYDNRWAQLFEEEKERLRKLLGKEIVGIVHVGSTSIPGLCAKPIIDIMIVVKDIASIDMLKKILGANNYEYRENASSDERVFFAKGPHERRTHYLHVVEFGSNEWNSLISFRDYLREHDDVRAEYELLKKSLYKKYADNRDKYTVAKDDFIKSILKQARNIVEEESKKHLKSTH